MSARDKRGPSRARLAGLSVVAGAAGAYFFDPDNGNRRRSVARDRITAFFRRSAGKTADAATTGATIAADRAKGAVAEAKRAAGPERPAENEQALADRVRTEIFRPAEAPKGSVDVNVEEGIVYLRGAAKPDQAESLVAAAREVDGVRGVENMLHAPGEPAPHKQETEEETRRRVSERT